MSIELLIYLIDRVPESLCGLSALVIMFFIIGGIGHVISIIVNIASRNILEQKLKKDKKEISAYETESAETAIKITDKTLSITRKMLIFVIIVSILCVLVPSRQALYLMAGAHLAKESGVPQRVIRIINNKLDSYIDETGEAVTKKLQEVGSN